MKFVPTALMLLLACSLLACAKKQPQGETVTDIVARTLVNAAEDNHRLLASIATLQGQPAIPRALPPDPILAEPVTISWTGPANNALKAICLKVGYRFVETGKSKAQQPMIIAQAFNRPAFEVLEDITWQIKPEFALRISPEKKVIALMSTAEAEKLDKQLEQRRKK